jgi:DNA-binding transcriptional ArsR family regulator
MTNISKESANTDDLAQAFALLGQPSRLLIVLAIGRERACVCHLEAVLGLRQAYISQQLMQLRSAGLVETERVGRHIFYHLSDPRWLELIRQAAGLKQVQLPQFNLPEVNGCDYKPDNLS